MNLKRSLSVATAAAVLTAAGLAGATPSGSISIYDIPGLSYADGVVTFNPSMWEQSSPGVFKKNPERYTLSLQCICPCTQSKGSCHLSTGFDLNNNPTATCLTIAPCAKDTCSGGCGWSATWTKGPNPEDVVSVDF